MDFGAYLRQTREQRGLSMAELGDASGITRSYIFHLETSPNSNPSLDVLRKLASALNMHLATFVAPLESGDVARLPDILPYDDSDRRTPG